MEIKSEQITYPMEAEAEVTISDSVRIIERIFNHFAKHDAAIESIENGRQATFFFGIVYMQSYKHGMRMGVRALDENGLAYMKSIAAGHLIDSIEGDRPHFAWTGDGINLTRFPNFREMKVNRIADITPHMRRITLSGSDLEQYATHGLHLKLFVPPEGVDKPQWPIPGEDGLPVWPTEDMRPKVRTYTVRNYNIEEGTLDVDFVIHEGTSVGSHWAMHAKRGDLVGIRGPVGRPIPTAQWYLLVGDETALPAIARALESLPAGATGVAFIEVANESEKQIINSIADVDIKWFFRNGADPGTTTQLVDAVRDVKMPPADVQIYAMAGVEYSAFKEIRRFWRDDLKLNSKDILPVAYWRRGIAEGTRVTDEKTD